MDMPQVGAPLQHDGRQQRKTAQDVSRSAGRWKRSFLQRKGASAEGRASPLKIRHRGSSHSTPAASIFAGINRDRPLRSTTSSPAIPATTQI
jgi:hypothetical protein